MPFDYGMVKEMETEMRRRVGIYTCWNCHRDFTLFEGQKRRFCPTCLPLIASAAGQRGGRPKKATTEHQEAVMARAPKIAREENQNTGDRMTSRE